MQATSTTVALAIRMRRLYIGALDVRGTEGVLFLRTSRSKLNDCDMNDHPFRYLPLLLLAASIGASRPAFAQAQASPAPPPPASTQPARSMPLSVPPGSFLGG